MARKKIPDASQLQSWDDVNRTLMEIARGEIELAAIEGDMNTKINAIKEAAEAKAAPIRTAVEKLGVQLKDFAQLNRPDFGDKKSKKLTFGTIGFRASKSIEIKKTLLEKIIDNLKKLNMADCVKVVETVDKDVLGTYPDDKIIAAGAAVKKKDTFYYETDITQLPSPTPEA
jgi:phage host-nuclease inhibitor protein Gam